jgi:translocation and assembly module TamB
VRIPRARIAPADLTHAVLASSDEVIVGPATAPASASHYQVTSDVTMALGDDVTVEGVGLKARLSGSITEHVGSDDQVTHATGEFSVAQGDYTAYGRKLEIERGRLIFSGGPIGDPGIDIRAIKRFDDPTVGATLAGINVRGTLRQPQLSFFSEPPLAQQQVVSLLLAGGGLAGGQTAAGVANTNASRGATNNELLGQGAAIIGQQLGSHVGIQDVGVESNIYNETSLVLGRYLSPRLYVSYGLGLTQTLNTVKLRYTLGDHWTVRTEAGQVSGADLVYTLDK